ncbi:hypothetical protein AGMMS49992_22810 [Clostridia bacterium]|nr:hypothetical protein AGMMS49992_22810 [Clostridia bacterium]
MSVVLVLDNNRGARSIDGTRKAIADSADTVSLPVACRKNRASCIRSLRSTADRSAAWAAEAADTAACTHAAAYADAMDSAD